MDPASFISPNPPAALRLATAPANTGQVPDLDPLAADRHFQLLPKWNKDEDVVGIYRALGDMLPTSYRIATMTIREAIASIRDLGMMASALARHGVDPTQVVPHLEERLLQLGDKVDMVPRDTVYHYGVWNPAGRRERRFTGELAEGVLIEAARIAAPAIDATLQELCDVIQRPFNSPEFAFGCRDAAQKLGMILCAIGKAKKEIPPAFFAQTLRPYFAELVLGGQRYAGASAAPLSVCIVDHLLWSSDTRDKTFRQFQFQQIRYNLPHWRRMYADLLGQPSLVTRLVDAQRSGELTNPDSLEAAIDLLQVLIIFRGRHRFVAMRAYDETVREFEVGSGGYGVQTLEHILALTRGASKTLRATLSELLETETEDETLRRNRGGSPGSRFGHSPMPSEARASGLAG